MNYNLGITLNKKFMKQRQCGLYRREIYYWFVQPIYQPLKLAVQQNYLPFYSSL